MKILIIEDEILAQAKLEGMLRSLDSSITILAKLSSVKDTIQWLSTNPAPDLAFVDIQLSDNHSFEVFRKFPVEFPVVFTTAFDKYLLESFEFNSIDYLLKPITEEKLKRSLAKMKKLEQHLRSSPFKLNDRYQLVFASLYLWGLKQESPVGIDQALIGRTTEGTLGR